MTRVRTSVFLMIVAAVAVLAASCGGSGSDAGSVSTDQANFTAPQLDGAQFDSASIKGKDTVLWFWAPWCTVCRAEASDVVKAADEFNGTVEVIGVAGRGKVPEMKQFLTDTGTGGLKHVVDGDGTIWSQFGVAAQPAYAFIDNSGKVEVFVGALGFNALTERMRALAAA